MTRISLADIAAEKPVKLTVEIPAKLHRDLLDYCIALSQGAAGAAPGPERVIPAMIERFISSDRSYARQKRQLRSR